MTDGTSNTSTADTNTESSKYSAPCRAGAGGKAIPMRTISRTKIIGACLAAAALLLVFSAPARADEAVLVSNIDQATAGNTLSTDGVRIAQGFTTGPNALGYDLGSIEVNIASAQNTPSSSVTVSVFAADTLVNPPIPGTSVCTLVPSNWGGSGIRRFGAASCGLTANTLYFVFMDYDDTGSNPFYVHLTNSDDEDADAAQGWSIGNVAHLRYETGSNLNWRENITGRSIEIRVRAANTAPTASDKTVNTDEDTAHTFSENDFGFSDADSGDELNHVKITSLPGMGTGTLSLGGMDIASASDTNPVVVTANQLTDNDLTYTPPPNEHSTGNPITPFTTFTYTVNDGLADSAVAATINITVNAVNDAPTASDKTVNTDEDTAHTFSENDFGFSDADSGDELNHVKITSLPGMGTGTLSLGGMDIASASDTNPVVVTANQLTDNDLTNDLTYTPPPNEHSTGNPITPFTTFTYTVNDGLADSAVAATINITVNAVNDPPVVSGSRTLSVAENKASGMAVWNYTATDPEGDSIEWSVGETLSGVDDSNEFSIVNGALSFAASRNFEDPKDGDGDNVYEVRVEAFDDDDRGGLDVTITVTDVEVAAEDDTATTHEDMAVVIDVVANDTDDPDEPDEPWTLSVSGVGTPANGTAWITDNSTTITYTPTVGYIGEDTFTYTVSNDQGQEATGTVTVTVTKNADLSNLTITGGSLTPTFVPDTRSYAVEVEHSVSSVTVTPITSDPRATVTVNGTSVTSGESFGVALAAGAEQSTITVAITHDTYTKIYTIQILRRTAPRDRTRPTVAITSEAAAPLTEAFTVTIRFSESVYHFTLRNISVSNGTASNFNRVSSRTYTVTITPEKSGEVRVEVRSNVAEDRAGNGNRAAEPLVIEVDLTRPEVEITSEATGAVSGAFEVTITFSEAVTGLGQSEITVTNGTVSSFSGSGTSYTVEITPSANGAVTVEIAADVAEDAAGNGNRAAEPLVIEVDLTRPEVEITSEATGAVSGAFEVTITFSEAVTGLGQSEITVTNGTVSSFSGSGTSYTVEITPSANGAVTVEIAADVAEDAAGNGNRAAEPLVIEADLERPAVTIEGPTEPVEMAGFEVTIAFAEPVEGFEPEDIQVSNGMVADFTEVSSSEYRATIKPAEAGQVVVVEVPEDVAEDRAGNGNRAAEPFEVEARLVVSYQEEDYTATEGGGAVTVTVNLIQGWDEELAIPIRVTRPDATEVADYTLDGLEDWDAREGTGRLTFPAEETEQTFTIEANHDGDGDDETVELGFGELPEIVLAGEPAVATVTLEDKGLVELKVSFGQAEYQIREGQQADIEVTVSPATDRRVEVPLVVALQGGTTPEDYSGVPALVAFEEGESEGTISVEILADEVNDPGEGIVLSFGELPEAVSGGEISQTTVNFRQQRTAEQFSQTLAVALAVMARTMGESAQTAIEGRFERHRQWSRLGAAGAAVPTAQPGSDNSAAALGPGESERMGSESLEGSGRRRAEGPVVPSAGAPAGAPAAMGSGGESGDRERSGVQGAWLRNVSLGGLAGLFGHGQGDAGVSTGSGMGPSGTGPTVGLGGRPGYGQNRFQGTGTRNSSLRSGSAPFSGRRHRELNLAGVSLELPLAGQQKGTSGSWVPALWGQGDLQHFNGNLTRHEMSYRGDLQAAHVGLDLYANDKVLAGLSFMRSWGDTDYSDDGIDGVLRSRMNTFHPYLYWQPAERVSVWGMGGLGRGQVDVNEPGRSHDFEADFRMFSGGVRSVLSRRGSNELGLRADAFWAQLGTEASEDIAKVRGEAHRARLMLEWVHTKQLSVGRSLSLKAEAGGRFDGGDAEGGRGAETGFRLGYLDASSGLDVALHGRVLVVHESDYRDWGLGVQASWDPGEKQRGFRVSVTSTRGQDGGGRTTLWNNANMATRPVGMDAMGGMGSQSRMESEVAYGGMKALGLPGLLTPYSRLRWAGQGRELAWGTAWNLPPRSQLALPLMLEMEAMRRRENRTGTADLAVLVRMSFPF